MNEHKQSIFPNYYFLKLPANCAPDKSPDMHMHAKNNSTSQKHFNNSIKIAAESVFSPALRTVVHMSTLTNITKILKQCLKIKKQPPQLHNKLALNIFLVGPNFSNILTTVKIVKKLMQAKNV